MKRNGFVSLWVGKSILPEDFYKYIDTSYTKDGDSVPSKFSIDFKIGRYDEDFSEVEFYEQSSNNINELLVGFSYDTIIIPAFRSLHGDELNDSVSFVVLLYDFQYSGDVKEINNDKINFKFVGTVPYK